MATMPLLTLSIILLSFLHGNLAAAPGYATNSGANFIRTSCRITSYPTVCVKSLWSYASTIQTSPNQLVTTALSVTIDEAQSAKTFISELPKHGGLKPREILAIKDCSDQVSDSVDQLIKSVRELKKVGRARGPELTWHMSNLQTWVSAALTDESTCSDSFSGRALNGKTKNLIRARMSNVAQVTSNALALCNRFAGKF